MSGQKAGRLDVTEPDAAVSSSSVWEREGRFDPHTSRTEST